MPARGKASYIFILIPKKVQYEFSLTEANLARRKIGAFRNAISWEKNVKPKFDRMLHLGLSVKTEFGVRKVLSTLLAIIGLCLTNCLIWKATSSKGKTNRGCWKFAAGWCQTPWLLLPRCGSNSGWQLEIVLGQQCPRFEALSAYLVGWKKLSKHLDDDGKTNL